MAGRRVRETESEEKPTERCVSGFAAVATGLTVAVGRVDKLQRRVDKLQNRPPDESEAGVLPSAPLSCWLRAVGRPVG